MQGRKKKKKENSQNIRGMNTKIHEHTAHTAGMDSRGQSHTHQRQTLELCYISHTHTHTGVSHTQNRCFKEHTLIFIPVCQRYSHEHIHSLRQSPNLCKACTPLFFSSPCFIVFPLSPYLFFHLSPGCWL